MRIACWNVHTLGSFSFSRVASRRTQGNSQTTNTIGGIRVKDDSRVDVHNSGTLAVHRSEVLLAFDAAIKRLVLGMDEGACLLCLFLRYNKLCVCL